MLFEGGFGLGGGSGGGLPNSGDHKLDGLPVLPSLDHEVLEVVELESLICSC